MAQADPEAEMVITGTVLTVDDARPTAEDLDIRATYLAGRQVYRQ
jgi:hypothetical protein